MTTKKIETPEDIYQIKVTLLGTSPPIWRRLLVPADVTLSQLHDVLQAAMGWDDGHMHEFSIGQRSGIRCPSRIWHSFCRASEWKIAPNCRRVWPKMTLRRRLGTNTT